jgi:NAD(P)-dependent dehydrogenase (short-subunit alcohol dehydrogenase family)
MLLMHRVAIITGGARGIGKGIAIKFAEQGCAVVIADVATVEATDTVAEVTDKGGKALFIQCDVTDKSEVERLVSQAVDRFGGVDVLVNNAGTGAPMSFLKLSEEEWNRVLRVNLTSVFLCCQAVAPVMKEKHFGKIINISSIGALNPPLPNISYSTSKAGLLGLTRDLALELAPYKICVNAILPGLVDTPLWDTVIPEGADRKTFFSGVAKALAIPLERSGTPEDVAGAALFLASEFSAYITGEQIPVAGGHPWRYMTSV